MTGQDEFSNAEIGRITNLTILTNLQEARLNPEKNYRLLDELAKKFNAKWARLYGMNFKKGKVEEKYTSSKEKTEPHGMPKIVLPLKGEGDIEYGHIVLKGDSLVSATDESERSIVEIFCNKIADVLKAQKDSDERVIDDLTQLFNRRYFNETMPQEFNHSKMRGKPSAFFMLDIDNFKPINDTYSHPAGDAILRGLGKILRESFYAHDIKCRYGGEEFTVDLVDCPIENAANAVNGKDEKTGLLNKIRNAEFRYINSQTGDVIIFTKHPERYEGESNIICAPPVTVSIGMADTSAGSFDEVLQQADTALYYSKKTGKDRLTVYSSGLDQKVAEIDKNSH